MINPLAIATRGRLSNSAKRTLTLATLGWILVYSEPVNKSDADGLKNPKKEYNKKKQRSFVLKDDAEVLSIINSFLQCQK